MLFPMKISAVLPIVAALFCASISPAQEPEKPRPEPREKMEMVKRKIQELREAGKHDEAAQLEKRVRGEVEKPGEGNPGEQPERMRHIAEAIKHLRAAGLNEPAEHIEQMVRGQQQKSDGRESAAGREGGDQMQRAMREMQEQVQRALKDMHEQTQRQMQDTHEQMVKMAHAIDELREQVAKRKE